MGEREEFMALADWCETERYKLGAVDGYDYRSGEEYGLRCAEIEARKRAKAISAPAQEAPVSVYELDDEAYARFVEALGGDKPPTQKLIDLMRGHEKVKADVADLRAPEAADAGAVAWSEAIAKGFMTACSGDGEYQLKIGFESLKDMQAAHMALCKSALAASPTDAGIAAPPAVTRVINPVDTHDWEKQLDRDGNWNFNSVCRRCKCELMPAFRGVSVEGTSPCPAAPPDASADAVRADDLRCIQLIHDLRSEEGDSVEILCDNPDGPPNNAVVCSGYWTNWNDRRFSGATLLEALSAAYLEQFQWKAALAHGREIAPITPPVAGADAGMRERAAPSPEELCTSYIACSVGVVPCACESVSHTSTDRGGTTS